MSDEISETMAARAGADKKYTKPGRRRKREEEALVEESEHDVGEGSSSEHDERELNLRPNVQHVVYCNFKFSPWYRSPRYFDELAPSGVAYSAPSLHLTKQQVKGSHNKALQSIRKRAKLGCDELTLIDTLYVCDTCFKYTAVEKEMAIHVPRCHYRTQLPGRVVYDSPYYQIRKIDGAKHLLYTQCLSLFAKLFLDHKSICYALEAFDFYVLTTSVANIQGVNKFAVDGSKGNTHGTASKKISLPTTAAAAAAATAGTGDVSLPLSAQRVVGFFSKEKVSWDNYNLACITIFPPFQKRGLGKLLIEYSYYLSRKAKLVGTPERPLSSEGLLTYLKYWSNTISMYIASRYYEVEKECGKLCLSINEISKATYISCPDVVNSLSHMNALKYGLGHTVAAQLENDGIAIDIARVIEWFELYKKKPSLVPLYPEYCIVRKKKGSI